jgi:hypothetical protein
VRVYFPVNSLVARLRAVIKAKDTEIAVLREQHRLLGLRIGELERRLGRDSTTSGTPPSKDTIGAGAAQGRAGEGEEAAAGPGAGAARRPQARRSARPSGRGPVAGS